MKTSELGYPVIAICRKGVMEYRGDEEILTTATSHELKIGWFDGMTVVDSNGKTVKVKAVKLISGKGRFWGYYSIFLDRIVKVELTLDDQVTDISFSELKKKVISFQKKAGESMDPDYAREVLQDLEKTPNVRALIEAFQPYNDAKQFYETLKKF